MMYCIFPQKLTISFLCLRIDILNLINFWSVNSSDFFNLSSIDFKMNWLENLNRLETLVGFKL